LSVLVHGTAVMSLLELPPHAATRKNALKAETR
jgi:hypothetical protein